MTWSDERVTGAEGASLPMSVRGRLLAIELCVAAVIVGVAWGLALLT